MKRPGQMGSQGIPINLIEVTPGIEMEDAIATAEALGAEVEDGDRLDSDFVINAIDFRKDDVFLVDGVDRRNDELLVVKQTNMFSRGIHIGLYDEQPSEHSVEWNEGDLGYAELWMHWLRGNVIPVEVNAILTRADTGEEVQA